MSVPGGLPESLLARFRAVAFERLEKIDRGWVSLVQTGPAAAVENELFRELHTLKGDARVIGFAEVALLCERLEDLLAAARRLRYRVHEDADVVVTMAIQFIGMLLRKRSAGKPKGLDLDGFLLQIEQVLTEWLRRSSEAPELGVAFPGHLRVGQSPHRMSLATRDRLSTVATTIYVEHLRATGHSRERLRDVWMSLTREIVELETEPVAPLFMRHAAAANELARTLDKSLEIEIDVGDLYVRSDVLDALGTAALHAIRNAVDHGIEPAETRAKHGKPAAGRILVTLRQRVDHVELIVADDGGGIDFNRVRRRAQQLGLRTSSQLVALSEEELADLLFSPNFSTRETVSEISGRGVGLDAVRDAIERFGGKVWLRNVRVGAAVGPVGTELHARVPTTRASMDVLSFRVPDAVMTFAVPVEWTPIAAHADDTPVQDIVELLELGRDPVDVQREGAMHDIGVLCLEMGIQRCALRVLGTSQRVSARRLCATDTETPFEVVEIDEREALLLRPDVLNAHAHPL